MFPIEHALNSIPDSFTKRHKKICCSLRVEICWSKFSVCTMLSYVVSIEHIGLFYINQIHAFMLDTLSLNTFKITLSESLKSIYWITKGMLFKHFSEISKLKIRCG